MRLSIFQNDDGLGSETKPPVGFACLHGTPVYDAATDTWGCLSYPDPPPPPEPDNWWNRRKTLVEHVYVTTLPWEPISGRADQGAKTAKAEDFTLFGLSPLMLLVIAGGGLWALSSMDGKKKKGGEY